jgi:hypothetical protein
MKHFMYLQLVVVTALSAASLSLAGAAAARTVIHPDDRAVHSPTAIKAGQSVDLAPDDRADHHPSTLTPNAPVTVPTTVGAGFDWADAGIGAATAFGLGLVGVGGCVLVLRQRRGAAFS